MYVVVGHDCGERTVVVTPSEAEAKRVRKEWMTLDHLEQVRVYRIGRHVFVYGDKPVVWRESRWETCGRFKRWMPCYPAPVVGRLAGRLWELARRQWSECGSEVVRRFRLDRSMAVLAAGSLGLWA